MDQLWRRSLNEAADSLAGSRAAKAVNPRQARRIHDYDVVATKMCDYLSHRAVKILAQAEKSDFVPLSQRTSSQTGAPSPSKVEVSHAFNKKQALQSRLDAPAVAIIVSRREGPRPNHHFVGPAGAEKVRPQCHSGYPVYTHRRCTSNCSTGQGPMPNWGKRADGVAEDNVAASDATVLETLGAMLALSHSRPVQAESLMQAAGIKDIVGPSVNVSLSTSLRPA